MSKVHVADPDHLKLFSSEKLEEAGIVVAPSEALKARKLKEAVRINTIVAKQKRKNERFEASSSAQASATETATTVWDIRPTTSSIFRPAAMEFLNMDEELLVFGKVMTPVVPLAEQPKVQENTSVDDPPPHKERSPRKRGPHELEFEGVPSKRSKPRKPSGKEDQVAGAFEALPVCVVKDKGVCSVDNPLLKGSLSDGTILVTDWLLKVCFWDKIILPLVLVQLSNSPPPFDKCHFSP